MHILIVKLSSIGDVVHALPAVAALRRLFSDAHISWVVERQASAVLKDSPVIDELIEIDTRTWRKSPFAKETIASIRKSLSRIRNPGLERRTDMAIDFQGLIKSGLVSMASGASLRIGFETDELREKASRFFFTDQVKTVAIKHVIEKNLALARAVGNLLNASSASTEILYNSGETTPAADDSPPFSKTRQGGWNAAANLQTGEISDAASALSVSPSTYEFPISVSPEDEEYVNQAMEGRAKRFAIVNPGGGWPTKLWPTAAYGQVADWLWNEYGLESLITYGPGEVSLADSVAANSRSGAARPFLSTIKQFVALARRAELFVGGDTGPLHLAAACRTPIVGIYGPTSPERNGPFDERDLTVGRDLWCRTDCHRRSCWHWECMDIPVSAVTSAISLRLERSGFRV